MKETLNASIASQSFVFEEDAYGMLKSYLDDIAARLSESERETLQDVEYRLAEIFREKLPSPFMVVTTAHVNEAMAQMGRPADFGERLDGKTEPGAEDAASSGEAAEEEPRRLRRSLTDRSIAGVCGGLGRFFSVDTTLIRLATLLLICFGGLSIWIYIILWLVVPEAPRSETKSK